MSRIDCRFSEGKNEFVVGLDHATGPFIQIWINVDQSDHAVFVADRHGIWLDMGENLPLMFNPQTAVGLANREVYEARACQSTLIKELPELRRAVMLLYSRFILSYEVGNFSPNLDHTAGYAFAVRLKHRGLTITESTIYKAFEGEL